MSTLTRHVRLAAIGLAVMVFCQAGCAQPPGTALEQLVEARSLTGRLLLGMARAGEASNRAVMSGSDEASTTAANDARQALTMAERDAASLGSLLRNLRYDREQDLLTEFMQRFGQYRKLNDTILGLAVQNTNLKAQQLSFGPAQDAARSFASAVPTPSSSAPSRVRPRSGPSMTSTR